jgi:hypothetical protein
MQSTINWLMDHFVHEDKYSDEAHYKQASTR